MSASIYWWPRNGAGPVSTLHRFKIPGAVVGGANGPTFTAGLLWTAYPGPGPTGTAYLDRWIAPHNGTFVRCILACQGPISGTFLEACAFAKSITPFGLLTPIVPPTSIPATPADTPITVDAAGQTFLKGEGIGFQLRNWPAGPVCIGTLEVEMDVST